jgi:hypothetical protein
MNRIRRTPSGHIRGRRRAHRARALRNRDTRGGGKPASLLTVSGAFADPVRDWERFYIVVWDEV